MRDADWRWRRARADTTWLLGWRRLLIDIVSVGIVTALALALFSSEEALIVALISLGASLFTVFVLRPAVALGWNYMQAPMRCLTDDVETLRTRLEPITPPLDQEGHTAEAA